MDLESLKDSYNDEEVRLEVIGKLTEDLTEQLKMKEQIIEDETEEYDDDDNDEEVENDEDDDEEEFSFACGIDGPPIAADEVFYNGQIRPLFPLFNQNLLLSDEDLEALKEQLPIRPPVKNIFIQTEDNPILVTSSSSSSNSLPGREEISGPSCVWSKNKAIEATADSPEVCKKSNSTGFSKLWRFKDFLHRSNSDGRDTFVFLNHTTPVKVEEKVVRNDETTSEKKMSGEVKINGKVTTQKKKKKIVKKSEAVLAHEAYMKSKAKAEERRRSYLPYRPELVGFFTNVNGGLTRNVHPF